MNRLYFLILSIVCVLSSPLCAKKHVPQVKRIHQKKTPQEATPPCGDIRQVARAPRKTRPIATGTPAQKVHKKKSYKGKAVKTQQLTLHVE